MSQCVVIKQKIKKDTISFTESPKILEALQMAEDYMDKTANFSGKVGVCVRNDEEYLVFS